MRRKINLETATLDEIWDECENVYGTPFGHNMIGIMCNVVDERFGEEEAQELCNSYQR
jgi:hypothetical protein|tara:strand:- start:439 stop:612 length:174 start_codon:yes stop_codon:yes gene_type:complete